uniref:Uncharacterized protein n=1 Tax=Caulobacter phage BL57 TaxID=3348355 RepID=A0AB74UL64_9VIRU
MTSSEDHPQDLRPQHQPAGDRPQHQAGDVRSPIRIQKGKSGKPLYTQEAIILDKNGEEAGRLIYDPSGALVACGARLVLVAHYGAKPVSECVDRPAEDA